LPRGNQHAAGAVVVQRGLTVRQTELLVDEVLDRPSEDARAELLARRMEGHVLGANSGARPRAVRNEADWMSADVAKLCEVGARLEARLLGTPLSAFTPSAAELLREGLVRLSRVLCALDGVIVAVVGAQGAP
jgi:hypothetical protein